MKNDDRYALDMFLRALLGVPWMMVNSLQLISSSYGLPIDFVLFDMDIHIKSGNGLIDGLLSTYIPSYLKVRGKEYTLLYISFIKDYERGLNQ